MGVADHPDRVPSPGQAAGQQGVVRQHRPHPRHDGGAGIALFLDMGTGLLPRHPFGCSGTGRDFPIHGHGVFHHHKGALGPDVVEKDLVQFVTFVPEDALHHFHAVLPQDSDALARHKGIGVPGARRHPAYARLQNGVGAGRLAPVVTAGLQGDVHIPAPGVLRAGGQRVALRMGLAALLVPTLADDPPVLHHHRPHHGVGRGPAPAPLRQLQSQAHIVLIVHKITSKNAECLEQHRSRHWIWTGHPCPRTKKLWNQ